MNRFEVVPFSPRPPYIQHNPYSGSVLQLPSEPSRDGDDRISHVAWSMLQQYPWTAPLPQDPPHTIVRIENGILYNGQFFTAAKLISLIRNESRSKNYENSFAAYRLALESGLIDYKTFGCIMLTILDQMKKAAKNNDMSVFSTAYTRAVLVYNEAAANNMLGGPEILTRNVFLNEICPLFNETMQPVSEEFQVSPLQEDYEERTQGFSSEDLELRSIEDAIANASEPFNDLEYAMNLFTQRLKIAYEAKNDDLFTSIYFGSLRVRDAIKRRNDIPNRLSVAARFSENIQAIYCSWVEERQASRNKNR